MAEYDQESKTFNNADLFIFNFGKIFQWNNIDLLTFIADHFVCPSNIIVPWKINENIKYYLYIKRVLSYLI